MGEIARCHGYYGVPEGQAPACMESGVIMKLNKFSAVLLGAVVLSGWAHAEEKTGAVLTTEKLKSYVERFNADDEELYSNIKNRDAYAFLEKNIPLFECPDEDFERTYYFRWWTYRKHVKLTNDGYVITEFMPKVPWSGKYNTINCPAAHHFYEGRWLHDQQIMDDYATFWLRKGGSLRAYSFWIANAYYNRNLVTPNDAFLIDLLPDLVKNYEAWEEGWIYPRPGAKPRHSMRIGQRENGLFYTMDGLDGGEVSIGGHGFRPTLNSFMYGDAKAIAEISRMGGNTQQAERFESKAAEIKRLVQEKLWDKKDQFFKILPGERLPKEVKQRSDDTSVPRHTWWARERLGKEEWVQYNFDAPKTISSVEVFWFQKINADGTSGCSVPEHWQLMVHDGSGFKPVQNLTAYSTEIDQYNRVAFTPVKANAIRLVAKTKTGFSSGMLDWRVINEGRNLAKAAVASASYTDKYAGTLKALNEGPGFGGTTAPAREGKLVDVRELYGYTPWYFNLPDPGYEAGWKDLMDPRGFYAPYGPTFAEQRHPKFQLSYEGHECQWNGPSWPLATCSVLTALANLLNNYEQDVIGKEAYFETLKIYTKSHQLKREDGKVVPWIDENLNPYTGEWISRTRLHEWAKTDPAWAKRKGGHHRGKDYNHSTYNDLIITGLVGLRPRADDVIEVNPLLPANTWDWFCLDNVLYRGRILTIIWDRTGEKYGKGKGLTVLADGKKIAQSKTLSRVTDELVPVVHNKRGL